MECGPSCSAACEILVPHPRIEPKSLALQGRSLTIRLPADSLACFLKNRYFKNVECMLNMPLNTLTHAHKDHNCKISSSHSLVAQRVQNLPAMQETWV